MKLIEFETTANIPVWINANTASATSTCRWSTHRVATSS